MKKNILLLFACICFVNFSYASPVTSSNAKTVANNFYKQLYKTSIASINLMYTGKSATGQILYYVYGINTNNGFVIVSADNAATPVLGYSNTGQYDTLTTSSNYMYWLGLYKKQLSYIEQNNIQPTVEIQNKWNELLNNSGTGGTNRVLNITSVAPLMQSTWDQAPYYNAMCPGGSVTGCVATAMAQVMRYWSYPARGKGSSCYKDTVPGYSENYGQLCADYDTSNYNWSDMPLSLTANNAEVAKLMYDCGVSVQMDYTPSESGAWVIRADDTICAQTSYVKYFGYDSLTINGLYRANYADSAWDSILQNELINSRIIQYAGFGTDGGHTWVCDGFNPGDYYHMNWGWSGSDNGFYTLDALNPGGIPLSSGEEALVGIQPLTTTAEFKATPVIGCIGSVVSFKDYSIAPSPITAWKWTFTGGTPSSSTSQNPTITYNTAGIYPVTEIVTSSVGSDTLVRTSYITIEAPSALPFSQGFEAGGFPPQGWAINNPDAHSVTWGIYNGVGGYGQSSNCMYYNNCVGGVKGQYDQVHTSVVSFSEDTHPFLYFDVAYAPYDSISYTDTLAVYYSTDCGTTWNNVYLKGGMKLSTAGGKTLTSGANENGQGCFLPLSNNWRTDTISLPALAGQSSVMFSFENRSGDGSNMYIDNINIPSSPLGVSNTTNMPESINVYPNPNNGTFSVYRQNIADEQQMMVYNVLGQQVYTCMLNESKTQINLNQPSGIYFYRILSVNNKVQSEGKLIIQ